MCTFKINIIVFYHIWYVRDVVPRPYVMLPAAVNYYNK